MEKTTKRRYKQQLEPGARPGTPERTRRRRRLRKKIKEDQRCQSRLYSSHSSHSSDSCSSGSSFHRSPVNEKESKTETTCENTNATAALLITSSSDEEADNEEEEEDEEDAYETHLYGTTTEESEFLSSDKDSYMEENEKEDSESLSSSSDSIENNNQMFDTDVDANTPLVVGGCSKREAIAMIMCHKFKFRQSDTATLDLFQLVNLIIGKPKLPNTKYKIKKLSCAENDMNYYLYCRKCKIFLGKVTKKREKYCTSCEKIIKMNVSELNYFAIPNIPKQIRKTLEMPSIVKKVMSETPSFDGAYHDVCDGSLHQKLVAEFGPNISTYNTFNDGAPIFLSSKNSMSCLLMSLNCLPFELRSKNIIVSGIWFGREDPILDIFLIPYVKWCQKIATTGVTWRDADGKLRLTHFYPLCVVADSVARHKLQNHTAFNGKSGCPWCYHLNLAEGRNYNRYEQEDTLPQDRTDLEWLRDANIAQETGCRVNGIIGKSLLLNIPGMKAMSSFTTEIMHSAYLGVGKYMLDKLWLKDPKAEFYIGLPVKLKRANKIMMGLRFPKFKDTRLPRNFTDRKNWKASEWKWWLLYISIPILTNMLPQLFLTHWSLLVKAIYLLNQAVVTTKNIEDAEKLILIYVWGVQILYGKKYMTFNVHSLLHLGVNVTRSGPLFCTAAFMFESEIGNLKSFVTASFGVVNQIMERVLQLRDMPAYVENFSQNAEVTKYCMAAVNPVSIQEEKIGIQVVALGKPNPLKANEMVHKKININGVMYRSSSTQTNTKNMDSCARLFDGRFAVIRVISTSFKRKDEIILQVEYLLTENVTEPAVQKGDFPLPEVTLEHMFHAKYSNETASILPSEVAEKCIFLEIGDKIFVCVTPNKLEVQ